MNAALGSSLVLAIDTCGSLPGVALATDGRLLDEAYLDDPRPRGERVAGRIAELLSRHHLASDSLSCCAVTIGPGSYTGLRIGLALVRGLALPGLLPVVGMGSLELAARAVEPRPEADDLLCIVLPAGRTRVYAGGFRISSRAVDETAAGDVAVDRGCDEVFAPMVVEGEDLLERLRQHGGPWLLAGEGAEIVAAHCGSGPSGVRFGQCRPGRAGVLAEAAAVLHLRGRGMPAEEVLPLYIGPQRAHPNRNRVAAVAVNLRHG